MLKNRIFIVVFSLVMFFGASNASAQKVESPMDIACEQAVDLVKRQAIEIESLKAQNALKDERLALKDEQIKNREEKIALRDEQIKSYTNIDKNSEVALFTLRQQITEDLSRIRDLENENRSLRSSRNWRTVLGFSAGAAAGYYIGKK